MVTGSGRGGRGGGGEDEDDYVSVGNNNAMMGNTLTPDDTYAAAGLGLGKVPY